MLFRSSVIGLELAVPEDTLQKSVMWTGFRETPANHGESCLSETSTLLTAAAAKLLQSCPTLCDPIDGSPPGSAIHGIFQARVLEWSAIAFSA